MNRTAVQEVVQSKLNASKVVKILRNVFYAFGMWRDRNQRSVLYNIYGGLYLFLFSAMSTFFMAAYLFVIPDISEVSNALYMLLIQLCAFIKFICFHIQNDEMQMLFNRMESFTVQSEKERNLVKSRLKFFIRIYFMYLTMSLMAGNTHVLGAFFRSERVLPFTGWYPVDWKNNTAGYVIALTYQYLGVIPNIVAIITYDLLISFLMFIVSLEMDMIGKRLSCIGTDLQCKDEPLEILVRKNLSAYIEIHKLHKEAVEFNDLIQMYFTVPFFFQVFTSGLSMSAILKESTKVSYRTIQFKLLVIKTINYIHYPFLFS